MGTTTMGVKLDDATRERIKSAASRIDRTPHWLIKQAIFNYLEKLENDETLPELPALLSGAANESDDASEPTEEPYQPFLEFAEQILPQSVSRAAITAAWRRPETDAVPMLLEQARLPQPLGEQAHKLAYQLAEKLRNQKTASGRAGMVQSLLQEFSLSSQEGVALMCLAEALLRIPDKATRDALIRDKISNGNWQSHIGRSPSLFVNAATWGLLFTGKLVSTHNETSLSRSLNRIIGKSGEPLIRKGVDMAMRLMGEQFVTGETIAEALANARKLEDKGFRYSYDMLGEAALTADDAQAYMVSYQQAIHAIGKASNGRGIYEGPGISIKLSALHPRYSRAQYDRAMEELYPRLKSLTIAYCDFKDFDALNGLNIETLFVWNNKFTHFPAGLDLPRLESLYLSHNRITDLSFVASYPTLKCLHVNGNRITDLAPLAGCAALETLHIDDNPLATLAPLAGRRYRRLHVSNELSAERVA